jgi:hypothetical protein
MFIILRGKQINEATVRELEKQRQVFRNSAFVKKRGLHNPILIYEVRIKIDDYRISTYCNNFDDISQRLDQLGTYPLNDIEVEVYDNYFLENFIKTT